MSTDARTAYAAPAARRDPRRRMDPMRKVALAGGSLARRLGAAGDYGHFATDAVQGQVRQRDCQAAR